MRVLVCGGAGFVGSHLVDRLVSEDHDVVVVDDLSRGRLDNLGGANILGTAAGHRGVADQPTIAVGREHARR